MDEARIVSRTSSGQSGRRCFLDDLLLAALQGAVPVAQVDNPLAVADDLHLNVPGARDKLFKVHGRSPRRLPGPQPGRLDG